MLRVTHCQMDFALLVSPFRPLEVQTTQFIVFFFSLSHINLATGMHWESVLKVLTESRWIRVLSLLIHIASLFTLQGHQASQAPFAFGKSMLIVSNHFFIHVPYSPNHSEFMVLNGQRSLWLCPNVLERSVVMKQVNLYVYTYTHTHVERHRGDFKS